MKQLGDIDHPSPSYDVDDEALSGRIDEILEELKPYPHLDLIREVLVTGAKLAQEDCSRGDLKILRSSIRSCATPSKFSQITGTFLRSRSLLLPISA